jgi:hypothetical protein
LGLTSVDHSTPPRCDALQVNGLDDIGAAPPADHFAAATKAAAAADVTIVTLGLAFDKYCVNSEGEGVRGYSCIQPLATPWLPAPPAVLKPRRAV